jgi:hypothetical protein
MKRRLPTRFERSGIRLFQVVLSAPLLLAEHNPLAALVVIGVLEWILRNDWTEPTMRGLTADEWTKVQDDLLRRGASERTRALAGD